MRGPPLPPLEASTQSVINQGTCPVSTSYTMRAVLKPRITPPSQCIDSQGHLSTLWGGVGNLHIEKLCFASLDSGREGWGGPWQLKELPLSCVKEGERHILPCGMWDL